MKMEINLFAAFPDLVAMRDQPLSTDWNQAELSYNEYTRIALVQATSE